MGATRTGRRGGSGSADVAWEGLSAVGNARFHVFMTSFESVTNQMTVLTAPHARTVMGSLGIAATAFLSSLDTKCTLAAPPSDVETRPLGPDESMITLCFHSPSHCWRLDGTRIVVLERVEDIGRRLGVRRISAWNCCLSVVSACRFVSNRHRIRRHHPGRWRSACRHWIGANPIEARRLDTVARYGLGPDPHRLRIGR